MIVILRIVAVMHGLTAIVFMIPLVIAAFFGPFFQNPARVWTFSSISFGSVSQRSAL